MRKCCEKSTIQTKVMDGLLHITDMSWGRINHPSEMLKHGQEIEVMILKIDREKEKIALLH